MRKYCKTLGIGSGMLVMIALTFFGCADETENSNEPLDINAATDVTAQPSDDEINGSETTIAEGNASDGIEAEGNATSSEAVEETDEEASEGVRFMSLSEAGDVVEFVEIDRYMGLWYEIATTPSFQQRNCSRTQAVYTLNESEGYVELVNRCQVGGASGRVQEVSGRANVVDADTQATLNVTIFGQAAPYWVVALDGTRGEDPYQWAVASVPGGRAIWVLSRTPELTTMQRDMIFEHLADRDFAVENLIETRQVD